MADEKGRKTVLSEYLDYATVHGLGRSKNSPYIVFKLLWALALLASLGMIIWQVYDLYKKYDSHPISTNVEVQSAQKLAFPSVTICNTNPAQYSKIDIDSNLDTVIEEASNTYSVALDIYNSSDIYEYNYTAYDASSKNITISNDIMWKTAAQFRMHLATLDMFKLQNISQPFNEFFLLCNFAGKECDSIALTPVRSYDYGLCYKFEPKYVETLKPHGKVADAGPKYALEVLLNVDQSESIPFVTSSAGVVVGTDSESRYFHENHGVFVPTGFETNIALSYVSKVRVPGHDDKKRCEKPSWYQNSLLDCQKACRLNDINEKCDCFLYFFEIGSINASVPLNETYDPWTGFRPCFTAAHYECIKRVDADYVKEPPDACGSCLPPCTEGMYERDVSMATWPGETFLPILRRIVQSRLPETDLSKINRDYVRGNLALVRIYLSSLSYQIIEEEYAYSEVDFISDIGGQLGLWAGFSVLSILEVVELVLLMCATGRKANKTNPGHDDIKPQKH